jgi:hypothetical protein
MMRADDGSPGRTTSRPHLDLRLSSEGARAVQQVGQLRTRALPNVEVGQMWLASWADVTVLGVVIEIDEGFAEFAPTTVDIEYADPFTAVVYAGDNPLPVKMAVFTALTTPVPLFTLQVYFGDYAENSFSDVVALWRSSLSGRQLKVKSEVGGLNFDHLEARQQFRRELSLQLATIAAAQISDARSDSSLAMALPDRLNFIQNPS